MRNEQAAAVILPWTKERHPDKYADTLKLASNPQVFPKLLARLTDIRWKEEPSTEWLRHAPLSLLEMTAISLRARLYGVEIVIAGQKVQDRSWSFAEIQSLLFAEDPAAEFAQLLELKTKLDLTVVEAICK